MSLLFPVFILYLSTVSPTIALIFFLIQSCWHSGWSNPFKTGKSDHFVPLFQIVWTIFSLLWVLCYLNEKFPSLKLEKWSTDDSFCYRAHPTNLSQILPNSSLFYPFLQFPLNLEICLLLSSWMLFSRGVQTFFNVFTKGHMR